MDILFKRIRVESRGPFGVVFEKHSTTIIGLIWHDGFEPFNFWKAHAEKIKMVDLDLMSEIGIACLLMRPTRT